MSQQPPPQTFASRQLAWLMPVEGPRSRRGAWAVAAALAVLILVFQGLAPPAATVILLHLLLTAQAVWFLGVRIGVAIAAGMVFAAGFVTHESMGAAALPIPLAVQGWNLLSRLLSVAGLAFVLGGFRRALEVERWRASIDHLTGALNRAAFEERLDHAVRRAEAEGGALVLAFMDLDGFKSVNDRHGHAAGNKVLAAFARAAGSAIRPDDLFARVGGDEFAALLAVTSCLEGDRVAELLHRRLSLILVGTGFEVTCSMGALVMDARAMRAERDVVEQADRLMYVAKQSGKNALHIGRGEALEDILRTAFPVPHDAPPAMTGLLRWADQADRAARGGGGRGGGA